MNVVKQYGKILLACGIATLVLYLFYRSVYVLLPLPFWFYVFHKWILADEKRKYKEKLNLQFKDALLSFAASLRAGYSMENAVRECYEEMKMMYGAESPVCTEFQLMIRQMDLSVSVETLFFSLGEKSGIEDIATFASVFSIAKRTGGDMVVVIRKTADEIAAKIDTQNEISVILTSKRFEQNIMNVVPMGIIVYVSLTSGGLLDSLYGNAVGIIVMTICLGLYCFAIFLSRKILDIRV